MTTSRLASLALLGITAATTTASANVVATDTYAEPAKPTPKRIEGRVGMLLGGSDVGDADGFSAGVSTGLGYRLGDITVRARFDHYRVGDGANETMDRRGRGTRVGGAVRYSFANSHDHERERSGLAVDFWGEIGMGLEHISWRPGGVLDRASGEIAVGFELDRVGKRNARYRRSHVGYFMAFRTLVGAGPEMEGPAVCGGPCTRATKPSRIDTSMFFELGLHWGR